MSGPKKMLQQYGPTILHKLQILWTHLKNVQKKFVQNILASKPSLLVVFTVTENQVFSKLASFFYCNSGTDSGILLKAKSHNEDRIISYDSLQISIMVGAMILIRNKIKMYFQYHG